MKQTELFDEPERDKSGNGFSPAPVSGTAVFEALPGLAKVFELSIEAYYAAIYAVMSGLPIMAEISRFIQKAGGAGDRVSADKAASDRGDPDVLAVLKAAAKVQHEIHRVTGFLRFSPAPDGTYSARCAPDYFILPALAEHFTLRFGETPWAIIDEKRGLRLFREKGGNARIVPLSDKEDPPRAAPAAEAGDDWENLWRLYHRSINNESRNNPELQRKFMPARYRKYLCELK